MKKIDQVMKKMLKLCENLPKIWKKFAKKLTQMGRKQRKFIKNHETVLKIDLKYEKKIIVKQVKI